MTRNLNQYYILMEKTAFLYLLFFITFLSLLGISTSSSPCNTTDECRTNSNLLFICCDNTCQLRSECRSNGSSGTLPSSSNPNSNFSTNWNAANSTAGYDSVNINPSQPPCAKDEHCNSSATICISLECLSTHPDNMAACEPCESIGCKDGRCYNSSVEPTTVATKGAITTLQLVLLFGSMGGILLFIIVVYCVKTFTDNRQRQYLLKHGVWDNPPNKDAAKEKNEDSESKSDSNRQQRTLQVPTITVETETEPKKKKKKKENSKDEITDTEGLEEFAVQQEQDKQAKERRKILSGCASKGCQTN